MKNMKIKVSKKIQENVNKLEKMTFDSLKDFQKKTVERVASLFKNNQNRLLVADEVGLGKTMIAKGVIAKMAQIRIQEGDDLFKVVYICSNQAIAKQNIKTLDIVSMLPEYANDNLMDICDTRLSMQHLTIAKQENDALLKEKFIQIIPLTPGTSFEMSRGIGNIRERALMYAVLKRAKEFKNDLSYLKKIMIWDATRSGNDCLKKYDDKVEEVSAKSKNYPENIIKELRNEYVVVEGKNMDLLKFARKVLDDRKSKGCKKNTECSKCEHNNDCKRLISELRIAFAKISTKNLNPDLVIMDEFQRFNSLIDINNNEDAGILAKKFLQENPEDNSRKTRVLLLSATPYKLYTTMEELDENSDDDPYKEFFNVMDFLFEKDKDVFHKKWLEYSSSLQTAQKYDSKVLEVLKDKKMEAENAMYKGACRKERISVMEDGDFIDDSSKDRPLKISEGDIKSYIQMKKLLNKMGINQNLPVDYVKSCPYLMSFMNGYKLKDTIKKIEYPDVVDDDCIWLNPRNVESYKEIPDNNARLTLLKELAFKDNAENLLWIPPCRPYYNLEGPYKEISNFTKTLVFSSWEMVPRMISTLLSYEYERKIYKNKFKYSNENKRKISRRFEFKLNKKRPVYMNLFSLIYPSKTLAALYDPIDCMNRKLSLAEIENEIKAKISLKLEKLKKYENENLENAVEASNRWYYFAPMLMDDKLVFAKKWLSLFKSEVEKGDKPKNDGLLTYLNALENLFNLENPLGKMPNDLCDYLCDLTLASFAVCYYRSCRKYNDITNSVLVNATLFAKEFINNFNSPEFITVVDNQYGQKKETSYLRNVLHYCKDGCFQGMLDEYINLLQRNNNGAFQKDLIKNINLLQTCHYDIDTKEPKNKDAKKISMRSHFAACFSKSDSDKSEGNSKGDRKENLRNAFNSPLRPFVLASTSIGQEGLDFHNYCRRIMHWNLPSNPIDLEQREGRINRYKCLAVRQNVADKYGNEIFKTNFWNEMFEKAEAGEKEKGQSELIPFWCFGKNQKIKIERILPMYPMSSDINRYERLIKILSFYRMTLGQPRQEELLENIFSKSNEEDLKKMKTLFIDLSPWTKEGEK